MIINPKQLQDILLITFGAILLLSGAIWNGFPILYSDTSTYIASGFTLETPVDRPMMYGLFIRLTSFNGISLWSTIFIQNLIVASLLFITIRDFTRSDLNRSYFIVIVMLSFFTALPFVSGQILADVFTSICTLSIIHLIYNDKISRLSIIGLFVLFFFSNTMHMSHLAINMIVVLCSILLYKFWRKQFKINLRHSLILLALIVFSTLFMGSTLSKSKHVFFTGRMAGNGILQDYLIENCPEKKYKLCDCIDSIPNNTNDFLWQESSPLYTRYESWRGSKEDFNDIILGTITTPHYIVRHIRESIKNTSKQLISFDVGDGNGSFGKETLLFQRIKKNFPNDYRTYLTSFQYEGKLAKHFIGINMIFQILVVLGFLLIFLIPIIHKLYSPLRKISILLLISIIVNCFINSSLVVVADRFAARTIWLVPFIGWLFLIDFLTMKYRSKKDSAQEARID